MAAARLLLPGLPLPAAQRAPVAVTSLLITGVVAVYLTHVWPLLLRAYGPFLLGVHFAGGLLFLSTIVYTYTRAVLAAPSYAEMSIEPDPDFPEHCHRCGLWRPQGAHHCSICGRCIAGFDHHCLLLGTCIADNNYRLYLLFVLCLFAGSTFYVPTPPSRASSPARTPGCPPVKQPDCQRGPLQAASALSLLRSVAADPPPLPLVASFVLTAAVAVCLGPLLLFHCTLLLLGMSTLDALAACGRGCAVLGSRWEACQRLLPRQRVSRRTLPGEREV